MKKFLVGILFCCCLACMESRAQFTDSQSGLLQMPSGEMHADNTFMVTVNRLNQHSLPTSGWRYDTIGYGLSYTFWGRVEVGFVFTIFWGDWDPYAVTDRQKIMKNQDRHMYGRIQLLKEGEFGLDWMPALVIGISDPTTGAGVGGGYLAPDKTEGNGNGYFNRNYVALTKTFNSPIGSFCAHLAYQYNKRLDYPLNGPAAAVTWEPIWLQDLSILDKVRVIAEYDSRTFNMGFIASIWGNRFEAMFELQKMRWINFGVRYNLVLR